MKPYGLISDCHFFNWSAFSSVDADGRNTRLMGLLNEVKRCAQEVLAAGGDTIYIAGDVFHVRGNIAPSVLNPTMDTFNEIIRIAGVNIVALPGNHDLEGKHSTRLGAAITALESIGVEVKHHSERRGNVVLFPWCESVDELWEELRSIRPEDRENLDALIHAPIDGVIAGLSGALDPVELAKLGYKRVFAGHYHNHKDLGNGVYSIGALAHHSWSDVGTKAGFLIVSEDSVRWMKSHLPEFIDITAEIEPADLPMLVEGNFVRAKVEAADMKHVEAIRYELGEYGAKGVVIQAIKKAVVARDGAIAASVSAGASIETSVADYVKSQSFDNADDVKSLCLEILSEAGC